MTTVPKPSGKAISAEDKLKEDEAAGIDAEHQLTPEEEDQISSHQPDKAAGLVRPEPDDPVIPV